MQEIISGNEHQDGLCEPEAVIALRQAVANAESEPYNIPKFQELMINFSEFTLGQESVALLIGAMSSGKTTFLKSLPTKIKTPCQLVQGCFIQTVDKRESPVSAQESTVDALLQIISHESQCLLIIDDADFLSMDSLELLLTAFNKQKTAGKCKLILAGENILQKRIEILSAKNELTLNNVTFFLEPLCLKETKQYLKQIICLPLPMGNNLFTKKNINKIYSLSEGYLGRINRVALQLAAEQANVSFFRRRKISWVDMLLTVAILCLLGVVSIRILMLVSQERRVSVLPPVKPLEVILPSFIASIKNLPEEILKPQAEEIPLVLPLPSQFVLDKQPGVR